jgi:hypothetical protein
VVVLEEEDEDAVSLSMPVAALESEGAASLVMREVWLVSPVMMA